MSKGIIFYTPEQIAARDRARRAYEEQERARGRVRAQRSRDRRKRQKAGK